MGPPVFPEDYLLCAENSLIDQSRHARMGRTTTNGDGFGLGWYGGRDEPGLFRDIRPAWNDDNLRNIAAQVRSPLFFAHVRAATSGGIARNNCHPFRYGRWLFMHNGQIGAFDRVRREIDCLIDDAYYHHRLGTTDSETFFCLMLTHGLEDDPPSAVERAVGLIERVGRANGVEHPIQMTVATTDGVCVWAYRYSSEGDSRSLYFSTSVETLREQYPDNEVFQWVSEETRLVVSEPIGSLEGVWNEVPESSWCVVQPGQDELRDFRPKP